ncbi:J domain-containing protein [Luteimonas marina]|uniref:J domain-containing protein n=1 Tax=Luteimonas marina TaxID=488485 RepID=A0A5C5U4T7_9GAMM|nr:DnaJ domain-containing protein [Luteimonas marina]TWT21077.1 J domain-containing protein [Luteimonas marina]
MTAEGGEALDVALALMRAPTLRAVLRARPLPDGVGEVLAIAAGSIDSVRTAAARTGYGEAELVEASRFYVQQVLLAEDADAYRTLGAERGAGHAVLRDHHRLLLRWLHPDRNRGAEWDSALSTRVNQAWNQVRTEAARAQYDATRPAAAPAGVAPAVPPPPYPAALGSERRTNPAAIAVALLGLACAVLAWFAIHREDALQDLRGAPVSETRRAAAQRPAPLPLPPPPAPATVLAPARMEEAPTAPKSAPSAGTSAAARTPFPAEAAPTAPPTPAPTIATAGLDAPAPVRSAFAQAEDRPQERLRGTAMTASPPPTANIPLASVPPSAVPSAAAASADDPLQLFREAEETLRSVAAYLAAEGGPAPPWLDMPTGLEAAGIRNELHARHDAGKRPRMDIDSPNWTLGNHSASMLGAYRLGGRGSVVETGILRVELARLERQWRVAGLRLEPAR